MYDKLKPLLTDFISGKFDDKLGTFFDEKNVRGNLLHVFDKSQVERGTKRCDPPSLRFNGSTHGGFCWCCAFSMGMGFTLKMTEYSKSNKTITFKVHASQSYEDDSMSQCDYGTYYFKWSCKLVLNYRYKLFTISGIKTKVIGDDDEFRYKDNGEGIEELIDQFLDHMADKIGFSVERV